MLILLKRYILTISSVLALVLFIYFFSHKQNFTGFFNLSCRVVHAISHPLDASVVWVETTSSQFFHHYVDLRHARFDADQLQLENMTLKAQILELQDMGKENTQLRQLLDLTKTNPLHMTVASVIGTDPLFSYKSVRIDKGSDAGIHVGMGVMTTQGVVGVITRVWLATADVLLLTDPNSNLDVFVQRSLRRGVLQGGVDHVMQFKYFDRGALLLIGDEMVTSGLTGAFPSQIPVGRIVRIVPEDAGSLSQTVDVEPLVDLDHLSHVLVLK